MARNQILNVWNFLRIILIAIAILSLLGPEVEGRKNRRGNKKGKRSKKNAELGDNKSERGSRRHRRERVDRQGKEKLEGAAADIKAPTLIQLFQLQQRMDHKKKADSLRKAHLKPQHFDLSESDMLDYMSKNDPVEDEGPLPTSALVLAKVDFLIHRDNSPHFYQPTSTTSSVTSSKSGLVSVHQASGKFGIHSKSENVYGRLIHISDAGRSNSHFACNRGIANKEDIPTEEPWIALISRGHCSFFTKIKLAERHNAAAVIVYDDKHGDVPEMFTLGTKIVALAIGQRDGHRVARLADTGRKVLVSIKIDNGEDDVTTTMATTNKRLVSTTMDNGEGDVTTTMATDNKLQRVAMSNSHEDEGPDNDASKPTMTSLAVLFAILAILFQNHVTC